MVQTIPVGAGIRIAHISDLHFDKIIIEPAYLIKRTLQKKA